MAGRAKHWWEKFRAWPTWAQAVSWVLLVIVVIAALAPADEAADEVVSERTTTTEDPAATTTTTTEPSTTTVPAPPADVDADLPPEYDTFTRAVAAVSDCPTLAAMGIFQRENGDMTRWAIISRRVTDVGCDITSDEFDGFFF